MIPAKKYQKICYLAYWVIGLGAVLWILLRSGLNPKRLSYPCQRAAMPVAASWFLATVGLLTGSVLLRRFFKFSLVMITLLGVCWLVASIPDYSKSAVFDFDPLPVWEVPDPTSTVYVMDSIPPTTGSLDAGNASVPDEYLPDPAIDTILMLLETNDIHLHKTAEQPDGIVGADNIVIIKGNYQWAGRGTTNTDRVKGLIWKILSHPDGFSGEIIVCDNTMDIGTGYTAQDNNSEDRNQSIIDVVNTFFAKGYPVYLLDWRNYYYSSTSEYSDGNYANGFIYNPVTKTTYPKFRSPSFNYYISLRYGIWDSLSASYDSARLCIVDFPVLKGHSWAGATIAVKNWIGVMTTAYADERYGGFNPMHDDYLFGSYALVGRIMALTYPDLVILDATWTNRTGPIDTNNVVNTNMLLASTDPVAISYYAAKYILTPIAIYPYETDPDAPSSKYHINLSSWYTFLKDSAGFACTMDSSEMSVYDRGILTPEFVRVYDGDAVNDGGSSAGVSWADYDNDDYPDLFVANIAYPSNEDNDLYHNEGSGTLTKVIGEIIATDGGYSRTSTWGDYDNDGYIDCFVANMSDQKNCLYHNDGGSFTKITDGEIVNEIKGSPAAGWADYDNDGDLDLFVDNYGTNSLFRNEGGVFIKIADGDITTDEFDSYGAAWADYDNDGDMDIFVATPGETTPSKNNYLYNNNGDGTFEKVTGQNIVTDGGESFGGSWGDYDNDGDLDLFVSNVCYSTDGNNFLYTSNGDGTFTRMTEGHIVNDGAYSFGSAWGDYDNDGDLDLFVANYEAFGQSVDFLYKNLGGGIFLKTERGEIAGDEGNSYGAAWADYDRDGDLDLFVAKFTGGDENNALYRNNGNDNNWVNIKCVGTASNKSAIGVRVYVKATINGIPIRQMREISSQTGYCGQNSLNAHFGLGNAPIIDSIVVVWTTGMEEILTGVEVNQFLTITEIQCGDVDRSGGINILDITFLIALLYKDGPEPVPPELGDVDKSGTVNILDITYLISFLYKDGPEPDCL